jgi:hypothetical protein
VVVDGVDGLKVARDARQDVEVRMRHTLARRRAVL